MIPPAPGIPEWCAVYLLVAGIGTVYVLIRAVWVLGSALTAGIVARWRVGGARAGRVGRDSVETR